MKVMQRDDLGRRFIPGGRAKLEALQASLREISSHRKRATCYFSHVRGRLCRRAELRKADECGCMPHDTVHARLSLIAENDVCRSRCAIADYDVVPTLSLKLYDRWSLAKNSMAVVRIETVAQPLDFAHLSCWRPTYTARVRCNG